jgi:hypothetical protein
VTRAASCRSGIAELWAQSAHGGSAANNGGCDLVDSALKENGMFGGISALAAYRKAHLAASASSRQHLRRPRKHQQASGAIESSAGWPAAHPAGLRRSSKAAALARRRRSWHQALAYGISL